MIGHLTRQVVLLLTLGLVTMCCFCFAPKPLPRPRPPLETFREDDLVGVWKADYGDYLWDTCSGRFFYEIDRAAINQARSLMEWLVLREDRTFYQVLQDRKGEIPDQQAQGTWWVERFPDKATRLHLEGGRFFAGDICDFYPELRAGGGYYSGDQTGHALVFDAGKAVIIVGWDRFGKALYLEYPFVGDPDAPVIVRFKRVPESEADSVPAPKP